MAYQNVRLKWGTAAQDVGTATNAGALADGAWCAFPELDISGMTLLDVNFMVHVKTHASSASTGDKGVYVYLVGTVNTGTDYSDINGTKVTTDGTGTWSTDNNLGSHVTFIKAPTAATTYYSRMFCASEIFKTLPTKIVVVLVNKTGQTLDATDGNHGCLYQVVQAEVGA